MNSSIEQASQFLRRLDEEARGIIRSGLARGLPGARSRIQLRELAGRSASGGQAQRSGRAAAAIALELAPATKGRCSVLQQTAAQCTLHEPTRAMSLCKRDFWRRRVVLQYPFRPRHELAYAQPERHRLRSCGERALGDLCRLRAAHFAGG
jgi:hypothetical protein